MKNPIKRLRAIVARVKSANAKRAEEKRIAAETFPKLLAKVPSQTGGQTGLVKNNTWMRFLCELPDGTRTFLTEKEYSESRLRSIEALKA